MGPEFNALDSVKSPCKDREIWRCSDTWSEEGHVMMDRETAETLLQVKYTKPFGEPLEE